MTEIGWVSANEWPCYSNTFGWNTFRVPPLTEQNKADLTRCAECILLAREAHLHRPPLQKRHRAAGKALRTLHQNDRERPCREEGDEEGRAAFA